jgi:hypothetical protein
MPLVAFDDPAAHERMIRIVARPSTAEALSHFDGAKNSSDIDDSPGTAACSSLRPSQVISAQQRASSPVATQYMRLDDMFAVGEMELQAIATTHRFFDCVESH